MDTPTTPCSVVTHNGTTFISAPGHSHVLQVDPTTFGGGRITFLGTDQHGQPCSPRLASDLTYAQALAVCEAMAPLPGLTSVLAQQIVAAYQKGLTQCPGTSSPRISMGRS